MPLTAGQRSRLPRLVKARYIRVWHVRAEGRAMLAPARRWYAHSKLGAALRAWDASVIHGSRCRLQMLRMSLGSVRPCSLKSVRQNARPYWWHLTRIFCAMPCCAAKRL